MGIRNVFLLFFSAMTASLIIMLLVYGLFIRDNFEFDFEVREPESAPSPFEFELGDESGPAEDTVLSPANVQTPGEEEAGQSTTAEENSEEEDPFSEEEEMMEENSEFADEPTGEADTTADSPLPPRPTDGNGFPPNTAPMPEPQLPQEQTPLPLPHNSTTMREKLPTLHYVYMDGFPSRESAERAITQMQGRELAFSPFIREHRGRIVLQFGVFSNLESAIHNAEKLRRQHINVKVE